MPRRAGCVRVLAAVLIAAACSDAVSPLQPGSPGTPLLDVVASGAPNGGLGQGGTAITARFVRNPHRGDAVIATFFWLGSINIVDSVTDFLTDASSTRAGNTYQLVEYVGAGGISMATYVATNVQNFPDTVTNPGLAVRAHLSTAVSDGGALVSAWSGVTGVSAQHHSASGSGQTSTVAAPGAITLGAGSLAYAVTMSNAIVGRNGPPQGFTRLAAGNHTVSLSGVAPNCTVSGGNTQTVPVPSGGTAPASFTVTCTVAAQAASGITRDKDIGTSGQQNTNILIKGFDAGNPRHGDALVATFFWTSATTTNIIDSVTDVVNDASFTRVGNTYQLVQFVHSGNMSMATYVATNIQNYPDTNQTPRLAVRANLRETITDGGLQLSAWSGVASDLIRAIGASSSNSGSGTTIVADPGPINVGAGALAYGVSLVSIAPPSGLTDAVPPNPQEWTRLNVLSDAFVLEESNYLVSA